MNLPKIVRCIFRVHLTKFLSLPIAFLFILTAGVGETSPTVTLALTGDIMLGRGIAHSYLTDSSSSWGLAFAEIKPYLTSADLAMANLESPITTAPLLDGVVFDLRAPPESVAALTEADFDLLSIANNHIMDCGEKGLHDTFDTLNRANIVPIGPTPKPVFIHKRGITLAFIAFDDLSSTIDVSEAVQIVRDARKKAAVVIVSIHWGREYVPAPAPRQIELAHKLAEAGATIIWGHHPHVLQPVKWINKGEQPTLVAYSLGNLLFDQPTPPDARYSAILWIKLTQSKVIAMHLIPLLIESNKVKLANDQSSQSIQQRMGIFEKDNQEISP